MQEDFEKVKLLLTTTTMVQPFNSALESILMTDASRLFGIEFALLQPMPKQKWSLIQCISASLTPTHTRYTTIKLECMAIQWAIQKCSNYQRGSQNLKYGRIREHAIWKTHVHETKNYGVYPSCKMGPWQDPLHC